jgi:hypothetical protein
LVFSITRKQLANPASLERLAMIPRLQQLSLLRKILRLHQRKLPETYREIGDRVRGGAWGIVLRAQTSPRP